MFQKLKIIQETPTFIVINKRAGLITERNPFEVTTVESLVEEYLTKGIRTPYSLDKNQVSAQKKGFKLPVKAKNAAFVGIVHRLDRVTSGTMVFAKKKNMLKKLNDQLSGRKIKKTYLAVLENPPPNKAGTLRHYLVKNQKGKRADIFKENKKGSVECTLSYELLKSSANGHLVKIDLKTGRFHQIRAQFGFIGCPVIGDEKYGSTKKYLPLAVCLHAWKIQFRDPVSNEEVSCEADVPRTRYWQDYSHIL